MHSSPVTYGIIDAYASHPPHFARIGDFVRSTCGGRWPDADAESLSSVAAPPPIPIRLSEGHSSASSLLPFGGTTPMIGTLFWPARLVSDPRYLFRQCGPSADYVTSAKQWSGRTRHTVHAVE